MVVNGRESVPAEAVLFINSPLTHMQCCNTESKLYVVLLSDTEIQTVAP